MPIRQFKPVTPAARSARSRFLRDHAAKPEKALTRRSRGPAGVTTTATSRCVASAAATSRSTASSISSATGTGAAKVRRSNTIRTARPHRAGPVRDGEKRYILPPKAEVGDVIASGPGADIRPGNACRCEHPARHPGAQRRAAARQGRPDGPLRRAAAQVMAKEGDYVTLRLPSAEMRMVHSSAWRRSARSATPSTRTSRSARPGQSGGSESAPRFSAR